MECEGLDGQVKRRLVKEVFRQEDHNILILMETKRSGFCNRRIASIWKRRSVEWDILDSIVLSRGIFSCGIRDRVLPRRLLGAIILFPSLSWIAMVKSSICGPIFLLLGLMKWGSRPFCFENMWLEHLSFKADISSWWNMAF